MLIHRYALPRMIEVGSAVESAQTLALALSDDEAADGSEATTATVATLTLYDGATVLLDAVVGTPGVTSTYSVPAATAQGWSRSELGLERWAVTVAGVVHRVRRPAMLVGDLYRPTITDSDLTEGRDYKLDDIRPDALTGWSTYRREADTWLQKLLISKGRRPWLIIDAWQLREPHILRTLGLIYDAAWASIGDGRYKELAQRLLGGGDHGVGEAQRAFDALTFRYDGTESGVINSREQETATPAIVMGAGPNVQRMDRTHLRQLASGWRRYV